MKWFETQIGDTEISMYRWKLVEANTAREALDIALREWCQEFKGATPRYLKSKSYHCTTKVSFNQFNFY